MAEQFAAERSLIGIAPHDDDLLFEVSIDSCFLTRTTGHGDPHPQHQHWRA